MNDFIDKNQNRQNLVSLPCKYSAKLYSNILNHSASSKYFQKLSTKFIISFPNIGVINLFH